MEWTLGLLGDNLLGTLKKPKRWASKMNTHLAIDCVLPFEIFLFKAHIFAGQVAKEATSVADFAWLTKEELSERLNESYWNGIKDLLADQ